MGVGRGDRAGGVLRRRGLQDRLHGRGADDVLHFGHADEQTVLADRRVGARVRGIQARRDALRVSADDLHYERAADADHERPGRPVAGREAETRKGMVAGARRGGARGELKVTATWRGFRHATARRRRCNLRVVRCLNNRSRTGGQESGRRCAAPDGQKH
ncbi:DoxX family protein [Gracilaria domingensis]|nr:DoxX family protein [Gracilaria domingensis]